MFQIKELVRKVRIRLFLGRGLTNAPKSESSSISDLFPIRKGNSWKTYFELINVNNLIQGRSVGNLQFASICFHAKNGDFLGMESLELGKKARTTIEIDNFLKSYEEAATFSVFHESLDKRKFGLSVLAERGYTGYEYKDLGVRGYVHGNLDSIALSDGLVLQPLGKQSILKRRYVVQHLMSGPAVYEFALTNPAHKSVSVRFEMKTQDNWRLATRVKIPSKGIHIFSTSLEEEETKLLRVVSKLAMGRPLVFRLTKNSMDVFHG